MHQNLSANRAGMVFDVYERRLPPRAVAIHIIPDNFPCRHKIKLSSVMWTATARGGTSCSHTSNTVPTDAVGREGLGH